MKAFFFACRFAVLGSVPTTPLLLAQSVVPATLQEGQSAEKEQALADLRRDRLAQAQTKLLLTEARIEDAEAVIKASNRSKPDTFEFEMETAQRWMQVVETMIREGEVKDATALVNRALARIEAGEKKAELNVERASAKQLIGFLQERYLANPTLAAAAYRSANQLMPEGSKGASEALERLTRREDKMRSKVQGGVR